jgi:hypothetical protein
VKTSLSSARALGSFLKIASVFSAKTGTVGFGRRFLAKLTPLTLTPLTSASISFKLDPEERA